MNLKAQRLRLLFVSDSIPDELERIVRFLNAAMPEVEVLAVEVKQFRSQSGRMLVSRVIGRSSVALPSTGAPRRVATHASFLEEFPDGAQRSVAERLLDAAVKHGAKLEWGSRGCSARVQSPAWQQPVTVAWLYPPGTSGYLRVDADSGL